jgi:hypothetical protein
MSSHKKITILENGPYLVSGSVPLAVETIGVNHDGESSEWVEGDAFPRNTRSAAAENRTRSRSATARTRPPDIVGGLACIPYVSHHT